MLVSLKFTADFSRGCAGRGSATYFSRPIPNTSLPANRLLEIRPSYPIGPGLCTTVQAAFRETPSSTSVHKPAARNLQLRQVLHCDLRPLSVAIGGILPCSV